MFRYTLVLQIFKQRARTKEAKLQVALAEIPYSKKNLALSTQEESPQRQYAPGITLVSIFPVKLFLCL